MAERTMKGRVVGVRSCDKPLVGWHGNVIGHEASPYAIAEVEFGGTTVDVEIQRGWLKLDLLNAEVELTVRVKDEVARDPYDNEPENPHAM